jgi:hypothetical protein
MKYVPAQRLYQHLKKRNHNPENSNKQYQFPFRANSYFVAPAVLRAEYVLYNEMTFQHLKLFFRKLTVCEGEGTLSKYHEVVDFVFFSNHKSI